MEMAMGNNETIRFNLRVTLLGLLCICSLASCNTARHTFNYKEIPCDFDFSIKKENRTLDITKYEKGKVYESDSCIIKFLSGNNTDKKYTVYTYYKKTGINKTARYDSLGNIRRLAFTIMGTYIGKSYEFDEQGNVIEEKNEDEGYQICWAQAMAIGKNYARKKMHEEEPELIIAKKEKGNRLYWYFFYSNQKDTRKGILIDGVTGKIVKVFNVYVEV